MFFSTSSVILLIWTVLPAYALPGSSAAALTTPGPLPLKYTAFFGHEAQISGIALDGAGNAYIAGIASAALPVTPGAYQTEYKPGSCLFQLTPFETQIRPCPVAFAAKLSHDGTSLLYLTYLGASNSYGMGVAVDQQGDAWITGTVSSSDLPVTPGAFQATSKNPAAFLLKLNPAGSQVLFATYLGGSGSSNSPSSMALDANGNVYVAGSTNSPDFPVTAGAFQTVPPPHTTPFIAKFDANGKLVYSTFFRGADESGTTVTSIAADAAGNAFITGTHQGASLPTTPGAFQTTASAISAAFAAKLNTTGSALLYSTYLAANSEVNGRHIAVDNQGDAYVTGAIRQNVPDLPSSYPVTAGAFQTSVPSNPLENAPTFGFITKLNPSGSALIYSTFLYASGDTSIDTMTLDGSGDVVVTGNTVALDFPTTPGALFQCNPTGARASAGFILKLSADGSQALYSTYLTESVFSSMAVDGSGEIYLSGEDFGTLRPIVPGSFGWTAGGGFVTRLAPVALNPGSVSCVVSAASRGGAAIAPGEIVDIFGLAIGPAQTVSATASNGQIGTSLGGVQVLFNGVPAPLLSAGPNQIRAIVPFETYPELATGFEAGTVQILNTSTVVQPVTPQITGVSPSIFTVGGRPTGQALMINQDGTLNSAQNPAPQGSIVSIYATGLNNTQPALPTGAIATGAAPLALETALTISSQNFGKAEITYAGAAPEFAAGLAQINFRIPVSIFHGFTLLRLSTSGAASQTGVYFYVQ